MAEERRKGLASLDRSDAILVRRWQHGDSRAAACLVDKYAAALGAVAYGILSDASLAEDVVQETFARATKQLHTLDGVEKLGGWLMTIARNVAVDMHRKRRREAPYMDDVRIAKTQPAQEAARAELREGLRKAVSSLPEDQRDLYAMKYVAGLSYQEMGDALGMTSGAVGQKLCRIRQKLRRKLEDFRP